MQLNDMLKFALESKVFNIPPHLLVEGDGRQEEYSNLDKKQLEQVILVVWAHWLTVYVRNEIKKSIGENHPGLKFE